MSKLKDLIALNILGWKSAKAPDHWACDSRGKDGEAWELPNGELVCKRCQGIGMEPETDLNDALVCLERAANGAWWRLHRNKTGSYTCSLGQPKGRKHAKWASCFIEKPEIAMCICALKAMGVPESEIQEAMK